MSDTSFFLMLETPFDSPIRPLRMPRFSTNGSDSPNENFLAHEPNRASPDASFPRQFRASPSKCSDRNVLFLLGSKINSSVPGRRSSIACSRDRKALAPLVSSVAEDEVEEEEPLKALPTAHGKRSKSLKALPSNGGSNPRTLRRL
jgi:hypothetical protein